jgi:hypothetical protein
VRRIEGGIHETGKGLRVETIKKVEDVAHHPLMIDGRSIVNIRPPVLVPVIANTRTTKNIIGGDKFN